jgi:hypothetical protein
VLTTPNCSHDLGQGQGRVPCGFSFLSRRQRVSAPKRPAERTAQAAQSGARGASGASARGGGANAAESAERPEAAPCGPTRKGPRTRDRRDREREAVAARFAVEAECCGAVGCHERGLLLVVETEEGKRVLCPEHAPGWVRR